MEQKSSEHLKKKDMPVDFFVPVAVLMGLALALVYGFPPASSPLGGKLQVYAGYAGMVIGFYVFAACLFGLSRLLGLGYPPLLSITIIAYLCLPFYFIGRDHQDDQDDQEVSRAYQRSPSAVPIAPPVLSGVDTPTQKTVNQATQAGRTLNPTHEKKKERCQSSLDPIKNHITIRCD